MDFAMMTPRFYRLESTHSHTPHSSETNKYYRRQYKESKEIVSWNFLNCIIFFLESLKSWDKRQNSDYYSHKCMEKLPCHPGKNHVPFCEYHKKSQNHPSYPLNPAVLLEYIYRSIDFFLRRKLVCYVVSSVHAA